jgi:threonine dehydrogenase-like Zn-dependent dehydrogenase
MRAAVWNGDGTLDVTERPVPEPRDGWVRVRTDSVGICGTDLHFFAGSFPSPAGLVPGHEIAGVVDRVGDGVRLALGTPIAVEPLVGCGECRECRDGHANRCARRTLFGVTARGGMAEYVTVPQECAWPLPPGVGLDVGVLAEPLAVCVRALRRAEQRPGARVAVVGAGAVGALSIVAARAAGASEVRFSARHDHQRELAVALGGVPATVDDGGFDVVVETVGGHSDALASSMALARRGGTVVVLGIYDDLVPISAYDLSLAELRLVGSNCYSHAHGDSDFAAALDVLATSADELGALVTHRFALDRVQEAFATAADKSTGSVKVVVQP